MQVTVRRAVLAVDQRKPVYFCSEARRRSAGRRGGNPVTDEFGRHDGPRGSRLRTGDEDRLPLKVASQQQKCDGERRRHDEFMLGFHA